MLHHVLDIFHQQARALFALDRLHNRFDILFADALPFFHSQVGLANCVGNLLSIKINGCPVSLNNLHCSHLSSKNFCSNFYFEHAHKRRHENLSIKYTAFCSRVESYPLNRGAIYILYVVAKKVKRPLAPSIFCLDRLFATNFTVHFTESFNHAKHFTSKTLSLF